MQKIPDLEKDSREANDNNSFCNDEQLVNENDAFAEDTQKNSVIGMPHFSIDSLGISYPASIAESIRINETTKHRII